MNRDRFNLWTEFQRIIHYFAHNNSSKRKLKILENT